MDIITLSLGFFFLIFGIIMIIYLKNKRKLDFSMNLEGEMEAYRPKTSAKRKNLLMPLLAGNRFTRDMLLRDAERKMDTVEVGQQQLQRKTEDLVNETRHFIDHSNAWFRNNGKNFQFR